MRCVEEKNSDVHAYDSPVITTIPNCADLSPKQEMHFDVFWTRPIMLMERGLATSDEQSLCSHVSGSHDSRIIKRKNTATLTKQKNIPQEKQLVTSANAHMFPE